MSAEPRIALLADIHGNALALEAVLADARKRDVQDFVIAGDLVMNGPMPAETLALVQRLDAPTLVGNTDLEVVEGAGPAALWARQQVGEAGIAYLRTLPAQHRVTPPGGHPLLTDLLVVHASPRSCNDLLILEPHPLGTTFTQPTLADQVAVMLGDENANLIVFGHIHYASSGTIRGQRLTSVGAVGFPFDGDARAAYALVGWDGRNWQIEHLRVNYDYLAVARDIEHSGQPSAARYARMVREADWSPLEPER